jgi:hypothetical protein
MAGLFGGQYGPWTAAVVRGVARALRAGHDPEWVKAEILRLQDAPVKRVDVDASFDDVAEDPEIQEVLRAALAAHGVHPSPDATGAELRVLVDELQDELRSSARQDVATGDDG